MSRVAKAPVVLPKGVELTLSDLTMSVKGPKGTLTQKHHKLVKVHTDPSNPNNVLFEPSTVHPNAWSHSGTARSLLSNMVKGVTDGFTKTLELVGVGYRAQANPKSLTISLGFSHPVEYQLPEGVTVETPNNTTILLKSIDKQLVGQVAAEIREFRPPEPYKGKGVKYAGEQIARKEAKKK